MRRPQDNSATGLSPRGRANNRRAGLTGGHLRRTVGLLLLALGTSGCSLSFPISGFKADETPTGSIERPSAMLSPALDREDWRRAEAALAVALDPQGDGAGVNWQNPQTGLRGSFAAPAPPFLDHDRVCRHFDARVSGGAAAERHLTGSACRDGDGSWTLRNTQDVHAT